MKKKFDIEKELNSLGHQMTTATILAGLFVAGALLVIEVAPDYPDILKKQILIDDPSVFYYSYLKSLGILPFLETWLPNYTSFLLFVFTFSFIVAFLSIIMFLLASYDTDRPHEFIIWKKHGSLLLSICVVISTIFLPYSILRFTTRYPTEFVILFLGILFIILLLQRLYWRMRHITHNPEDYE